MKKIKYLTVILLIIVGLCGCVSKNSDSDLVNLEMSEWQAELFAKGINCDYTATSYKLQFTSYYEWSITSDSPWVTITPTVGTQQFGFATIEVERNVLSVDDRSAVVTLISGPDKMILNITQKGLREDWLNIPDESLNLSIFSEKRSYPVYIESNTSWSASCNSSWCTVSSKEVTGSGKIVIFAEANKSSVTRSADVIISVSDDLKQTIKVTQKGSGQLTPGLKIIFDRTSYSQPTIIPGIIDAGEITYDKDWLKASWNVDRLIVSTIKNNNTNGNREAVIKVVCAVTGANVTIVVLQNRHKTGDYFDENGVVGVVFDVVNSTIMSLDEGSVEWSTKQVITGAINDIDGQINMQIIKGISEWESLYPAFAWCGAMNVSGDLNWYLPSKGEVVKMHDYSNLMAPTLSDHHAPMMSLNIWTSTELSQVSSWCIIKDKLLTDEIDLPFQDKTTPASVRCLKKYE